MITLEETKLYLRVDQDDEDDAIETMMLTAMFAAADYLNMKPSDLMMAEEELPAPVRSAMLLLVGDLYMNRELQADKQLYENKTYERLLNPYRVMQA